MENRLISALPMTRLATFAVFGSRAVEMAAPLRWKGYATETIYTSKRNKQFKRADERGINVLDSDKQEDWDWLAGFLENG